MYKVGRRLLYRTQLHFEVLLGLKLLVEDLDELVFRQIFGGLCPLIEGHLIII